MSVNNLSNTLTSEGLLSEPSFDIVKDFSVRWVVFVQHILELKVGRTESVAEVLGKDPAAVWGHSQLGLNTGIEAKTYKHKWPPGPHYYREISGGRTDYRASKTEETPLS